MADVAEKRMTVAEFLPWDDEAETRYELVRGKLVAMAMRTAAHSVIVANIAAAAPSGKWRT